MDLINEEVERAEKELETPFDEIYHRERKLIKDIVKSELQLNKI
jgi:hypothetical protein